MFRYKKSIFSFLLLVFSINSVSADDPGIINYHGSDGIAAEVPTQSISDFPGESINIQSQRISYNYIDVSIPGPNGLDINIERAYNTKLTRAWSIADMPRLLPRSSPDTQSHLTNFGCLGTTHSLQTYFPGTTMEAVGMPSASDIPAGTIAAFTNGAVLSCVSNKPVLRMANGHKYTFIQTTENLQPSFIVSTVEDRFGNKITYNYEDYDRGFNTPRIEKRLKTISRNDNVNVTFTYGLAGDPSKVTKIQYFNKSVQYLYSAGETLSDFVDEDGNKTTYTYEIDGSYGETILRSVTLPTGGKIEYGYLINTSGANIQGWLGEIGELGNTRTIASKVISGPDIKSRSFYYAYKKSIVNESQNWGELFVNEFPLPYTSGKKKKQTIYSFNLPVGNGLALYNVNNLYPSSVLTGRIERIEVRKGPGYVLQFRDPELIYQSDFNWTYKQLGTNGCIEGINIAQWSYKVKHCSRAVMTKETHAFHNSGGTDTFTTEYLNHDKYGYHAKTRVSSNTASGYRYSYQTYLHDKTNWILGLPRIRYASTYNGGWKQVKQIAYWGATHAYKSLPRYDYDFGRLTKRNVLYHSNGELKRVTYNGSLRYEQYENYKRGIPQKTTMRDRYSSGSKISYKTVDDFGNIVWKKDFNGNQTTYSYDAINRLTKTNFSNSAWSDISKTYYDSSKYIRTIQGNQRKYEYVDALGRIKKVREEDAADTSTRKYTSYSYDIYGHFDFVSFPTSSSTPTHGVRYEYDDLGRKTKETVTSSGAIRLWEYLAGNKVRAIDGRGYEIVTSYEARGNIDYSKPNTIKQESKAVSVVTTSKWCTDWSGPYGEPIVYPCPVTTTVPGEYITTDIAYDMYGKIDRVAQGGYVEDYIYDSYQQLCKKVRPDVGVTTYGYNAQRQVIWEAQGTTSITTGCSGTNNADKVAYSYDNRGALRKATLADGSTVSEYVLDDVGNFISIKSKDVTSTYNYNDRNLVTSQTTTVNGATYNLGWKYNSLGHMKEITYPDGRVVAYATNALGQQTAAGNYATSGKYHPSGSLKTFYYGNGIHRNINHDVAGVPQNVTDKYGTIIPVNLHYNYDEELNVMNITDSVLSQYNLENLEYDGVNRLIGGEGYWGEIKNTYDDKGNLKLLKLGNKTINYNYASNNRLSSISGSYSRNYAYDSRGNVTNNGVTAFNYNKANQLTSTQAMVLFKYDGKGLRTSKTSKGLTTTFIYGMNGQLLYRKDPSGTKVDYIYFNGDIVAEDRTGSRTYLHNDVLGSVVAHTNANKTVIKRYHYEPFGKALESGQNNNPSYTGHLYDDDLDLHYMKARYYDPLIGRFYSNDPVGFSLLNPMSFNRYAYANNNPYSYVDLDGRAASTLYPWIPSFLPSSAGGGAVAAGSGVVAGGVLVSGVGGLYIGSKINESRFGDWLSDRIWDTFGNEQYQETADEPQVGDAFPDRELPRDENGVPIPESDSPHTQLGQKEGRNGKYPQAREFDADGNPVRDIDFTDHGRDDHTNPHQHDYEPNETGGTPRRSPPRPLKN